MSATPTPWYASAEDMSTIPSRGIAIYAKQGPLEVCPAIANRTSDAALIVTAVNAHDDLVDALRDLLRVAETSGDFSEEWPEVQSARAALAKAEGR